MEQVTHIFSNGMDTDTSFALRSEGTYLYAENLTFTKSEDGDMGAMQNRVGNWSPPFSAMATDSNIKGACYIDNCVVLFTVNNSGSTSRIYKYENGVTYLLYTDASSSVKLGFRNESDYHISTTGVKESEELVKVYWVDGENGLRVINIKEDVTGKSASYFDAVMPMYASLDYTPTIQAGAGSYKAGKVYHAVQFYRLNGGSSTIISFPEGNNLSKYIDKDGGTDKGESTNCAIKIDISGINSSLLDLYNRYRIYSIFYDTYNTPQVRVVIENPFASTSISTVDYGDYIDEIGLDEFITKNQTSYSSTSIESKDSVLFLANISETTFESDIIDAWDSRAYRYNLSGSAAIYDSVNLSNYIVLGNDLKISQIYGTVPGASIGGNVPEEFDCYNRYNQIYTFRLKDRNTSYGFKYNKLGTALGGSGLNLSYSFVTKSDTIDDPGSIVDIGDTKDIVKHIQEDRYIECEDGEVYRIGIKFFNKNGQSSQVKWIGDVLWEEAYIDTGNPDSFPNAPGYVTGSYREYGDTFKTNPSVAPPYTDTYDVLTNKSYRILKVTIDNLPNDPNIKGWQIVRADRSASTCSVVGNGLLVASEVNETTKTKWPSIATQSPSTKPTCTTFKFVSPELMFNDPENLSLSGYRVRVYNRVSRDGSLPLKWNSINIIPNSPYWATTEKLPYLGGLPVRFGVGGTYNYLALTNLFDITDSVYSKISHAQDSKGDSNVTINGYTYKNQVMPSSDRSGGGCSSFIIELNRQIERLEINPINEDGVYYYGSIIRNADFSRYGGSTYNEILTTEYVPFSKVALETTTNVECKYGDVYTLMYTHYLSNYYDDSGNPTFSLEHIRTFPVQTKIDLRKRQDRILDYHIPTRQKDAGAKYFIQETVAEGIEFYGDNYPTEIGDLYTFNTAYLSQPKHDVSFSTPADFINVSENSVKIINSEKKINGEQEDSWLQFLPTNFIEVDSRYGGITELKRVDNKLFFWQENSTGLLAVNDRAIITESNGTPLSLGTGGVLERFDYISTTIGNKLKNNIVNTENGIFWYNEGKIYLYDSQIKELSTTKSVNKYIKDIGYIPSVMNAVSLEDKKVYFKLGAELLVYDTLQGAFTGVYTTDSDWNSSYGNKVLMYLNNNTGRLYEMPQQNAEKGSFFGTVYPSTIKLLCNGNKYPVTKVFDLLSWESQSKDSNGIVYYDDTFNNIRVYNSYQNTDWQPIEFKRKERTFKSKIPRDKVIISEIFSGDIFDAGNFGTPKRRMRDKYIILDLEYDNASNNTFSFPYININYRNSIR